MVLAIFLRTVLKNALKTVLRAVPRIRLQLILGTVMVLLLSSCSTKFLEKRDQPSLIPAQIPDDDAMSPVQSQVDRVESNRKQSEADQAQVESEDKVNEQASGRVENIPFEASSAPENLMKTLLQKARKAMGLQQWLRAQRALEQALRVDSKNVEVYVLYGKVYQAMGVEDQAEHMYQRALFLSDNNEGLINRLKSQE